jgi:hypothetical protein
MNDFENHDTLSVLFPKLGNFCGAYLNQDAFVYGDTLEDIVDEYARRESPETKSALLNDISNFRETFPESLQEKFDLLSDQIDVSPDGYSADTFLKFIEEKLSASLK